MEIIGIKKLQKLKNKNLGNGRLANAIDELLQELEVKNWKNGKQLKQDRPDADLVHNDGFYFFNINIHRTMILIEFCDDGQATIVWCGTHDEYELTFKNNKKTIANWLKSKGYTN
ncbi:type II toxin-antitoxin system HigB family toxin [Cytophaga hutchinsonii]|uniref:Addiction module toxin RelE n=1 Tax=Cytophaga hutchinsonii (strain ATCC 33406 / DSM 1761 / CIP 103989 / NBRC 15051 / NCIMB 9469 / D465) TaxID=269798 RepID=A0A6N4SW24_CYTH3|nr:type II toxin-antitoxin system HigB family toxin [Cytophaga hutchinsonii]ABG60739.1 hypothetical protein CHU_3506 [Cytophaga hutchinsonii ATCC 33406]SFX70864.1 HigB_toxin, RelE-like toxic component of a toxin-antitoxin system [Cytophaga hutchinsonii ATCC 33406]